MVGGGALGGAGVATLPDAVARAGALVNLCTNELSDCTASFGYVARVLHGLLDNAKCGVSRCKFRQHQYTFVSLSTSLGKQ